MKTGLSIVVLSNGANSMEDIGFPLLDDRWPPAKPPKERKEIALEPTELDAHAVESQPAPNFMSTIAKEADALLAQAAGQGRVRLNPEAAGEFFIKDADARISFVMDATDRVMHFVLHQCGLNQKASKFKQAART